MTATLFRPAPGRVRWWPWLAWGVLVAVSCNSAGADPRVPSLLYGVVGLPATFLVGRDGRAVGFAIGPREWGGATARALFDALLAEPAPRPGPQ